jgi:hypothetical protein
MNTYLINWSVINRFIFDRTSVVIHDGQRVNTRTKWWDHLDLLSYQNPVCEISEPSEGEIVTVTWEAFYCAVFVQHPHLLNFVNFTDL